MPLLPETARMYRDIDAGSNAMKLASAAGTAHDIKNTLDSLLDEARNALGNAKPDLAAVFFTSHFEDEAEAVLATLRAKCPSAVALGCSAEGVIGPDVEHERVPAVAVMLASLPGVQVQPFRMSGEQLTGLQTPEALVEALRIDEVPDPTFLFFADPFTVPVNPVLEQFNEAYPGRAVFGGMISGCEQPGQAVLLAGDTLRREGAAGVVLSGDVDMCPVVSQGCRPIGRHFVVTKGEGYVIKELGGRPPLQRLREVLESLSPADSQLAQQAIYVGRVINEYQPEFSRGDFLVRNLLGLDPKSGAIAVGDQIRVGATIQFHVRDGDSADEDLRTLLEPYGGPDAPGGAMLFSCNGRGTRMWTEPHHDVRAVLDACGPIPVAGFFAAGEIGPIGGRNFIHGHTASLAMFCPRERRPASGKTATT